MSCAFRKRSNYNTYAIALSLLVFVEEYERTKEPSYKEAANQLVSKLLILQIPDDKVNAGAWYTAYKLDGGQIVPSDSSCTGNEMETKDIDRCSWIGNTAWVVIAFNRLKNSGIYYMLQLRTRLPGWCSKSAELKSILI